MKWFIKKLSKKNINNLKSELNKINTYSEVKSTMTVTGHNSKAFGVRDFAIPTGICSNPVFEELEAYIEKDKVGQLLRNPIRHCIFYNITNGYCFFAGRCDKKQEISNLAIKQYIKQWRHI